MERASSEVDKISPDILSLVLHRKGSGQKCGLISQGFPLGYITYTFVILRVEQARWDDDIILGSQILQGTVCTEILDITSVEYMHSSSPTAILHWCTCRTMMIPANA